MDVHKYVQRRDGSFVHAGVIKPDGTFVPDEVSEVISPAKDEEVSFLNLNQRGYVEESRVGDV
jgi:hypothetical protein